MTYIINLNEYADVGTHWIPLYCKNGELFISIVLEMNVFLKKLKKFFEHKNIKANIFRVKSNSSMCGYFCIRFIDFMFEGKTLIDFTSLFSPYDFEKKINLESF